MRSSVGVPQIVPLLVPNERPEGNDGYISQERIIPGPFEFTLSGKSPLTVLFTRLRFSGLYEIVGN